jgi:tetratricopeptide (TPR) repeat protein
MNNRALKKFLSLPRDNDGSWQGGIVTPAELGGAIDVPEASAEMAMVLWVATASDLVHGRLVERHESRLEALVAALLEFCDEHDWSVRPAVIECNNKELADGLSKLIGDADSIVRFVTPMPEWNAIVEEMAKQAVPATPAVPSFINSRCTAQQLRQFAEASAAFYHAAIWDYLDDTDLIQFESPTPPRGLRYAVVLGAAGYTLGLGFYDDVEDHYALLAQRVDPCTVGLASFSFESSDNVGSEDARLWQKHNLPLATPEAIPTMFLTSSSGTRGPTPRELDFVTLILNALANTSEAEIDSGRWSKSVELSGKRIECVMSIPNLLDPPDWSEWRRRGLTPEPRINERHLRLVQQFISENADYMSLDELNTVLNENFTGPMDDLEFPMDTAADRAEARCQEAIESFGRRRVQLARQALAEDPSHVEANVLMAESTRQIDRRIEAFRGAKELGRRQLQETFDESVGHFWGITETRPFMRACEGLADALHESGRTDEAIEQYEEMLRLNPNDNQGVRYQLIPLLLGQNRESQAVAVLERFREETAFWHYANSIVQFRRSGHSAASRKAIRSAFRANEHVPSLLAGNDSPWFPDLYSPGSPEEAMSCIQHLIEAMGDSDDYVHWLLREAIAWEKETSKRRRQQQQARGKKSAKQKRRK